MHNIEKNEREDKRGLAWRAKRVLAPLKRHWKIAVPVAAFALAFLLVIIAVLVLPSKVSTPDPGQDVPEQTVVGSAQNEDAEEGATPPPSSQPTAVPPPPPPVPTPHSVLGLASWKLTLPVNTAHAGSPDEIKQPDLAGFSNQYFYLTELGNGVVFRAPVGGATTSNSGYPRSELREMTSDGRASASWSNTSGTHTMTVRQAITHTPVVKPDVVAAQIHDASDDVVMVRLEGKHLFVESGGDNIGTLDPAYNLGTAYTVKIQASGGRIKVWYNGALKVDIAKSGSGWYFKAGCYTQSNPSKGDSPNAYGEVVIYSLSLVHQ